MNPQNARKERDGWDGRVLRITQCSRLGNYIVLRCVTLGIPRRYRVGCEADEINFRSQNNSQCGSDFWTPPRGERGIISSLVC